MYFTFFKIHVIVRLLRVHGLETEEVYVNEKKRKDERGDFV